MVVLGINAYHADASAAILVDGKLVAAIEEERFTRQKHWAGFPIRAIRFCLEHANVPIEKVDHIAIGRDPKAKFAKKLKFFAKSPFTSAKLVQERLSNAKQVTSFEDQLSVLSDKISAEEIKSKIVNVEHHRSHLASAFFPSPFTEAAILSIDGSGDFTTTMTATGKDNQITVLDSIDYPNSVGVFYTAFTQLIGFPYYGDEYKVMGLSPYGTPKYVDQLRKVLLFEDNGRFSLNSKFFASPYKGYISYDENHLPVVPQIFNEEMEAEFGKVRKKEEVLTQYHKDLAASVQRITEELIFHVLNNLHKVTGLDNVCIAGGVAQNSVANGKITRNTPFKKVYIPSAGHDAGISMGAALYVHHHLQQQPRTNPVYSAYTGSVYTNEQVLEKVNEKGLQYKKLEGDALYEYVADAIISGKVIGWFQGQAEFGPRALGGRSILADPRRADAKDLLNSKIKRRESFRPFAPSILQEYVDDFFEVSDYVPFMEKVFPIKKEKQELIPAVTHVDGTGRLQTVDKENASRYYKLISAFHKKTGVPILLNTSFNENEPIVNAPEEAINCFLRTDMDMLVMENIVVER